MFPKPINTFSPKYQLIYKIVLPIVLIIWLLPLIAIFLTSVRSAADINTGNVFVTFKGVKTTYLRANDMFKSRF